MSIETQTAAPAAKDNLLGICNAIGTDFGFNPNFLRIPLAVALIADAKWTLIAYVAMGLAVLASRLIVRKPKAQAPRIALVASTPAVAKQADAADLALAA